jgi:hypothetical protein
MDPPRQEIKEGDITTTPQLHFVLASRIAGTAIPETYLLLDDAQMKYSAPQTTNKRSACRSVHLV